MKLDSCSYELSSEFTSLRSNSSPAQAWPTKADRSSGTWSSAASNTSLTLCHCSGVISRHRPTPVGLPSWDCGVRVSAGYSPTYLQGFDHEMTPARLLC